MQTFLLVVTSLVCLAASGVLANSARKRYRFWQRVKRTAAYENLQDDDPEAQQDGEAYESALTLAQSSFLQELFSSSAFLLVGLVTFILAVVDERVALVAVAVPGVLVLAAGGHFTRAARLTQDRFELERRAEEVLAQEDLAPQAWADRLAPDDLPDFAGYEMGRVYQAGEGAMAGDFFDVFRVDHSRVAAVIGDVAGRGIESSITAFQAKYLLRVFLRQFRDPAQALQELNAQMSTVEHSEEFISVVVVVFDSEAKTMRYTSGGHPAAWMWHEREVQPLRATGPLLMLDPDSSYFSREIPLDTGDLVLMYTDGLAEVRYRDALFGEDRIAQHLRRDPTVAPDVLCKSLLEAARDFAEGTIGDDVAILAIRKA